MTNARNFFCSLLVAALLPAGYLAVNPSGAVKVSVIDEQRLDINRNICFSDASGARIEFSSPVDLYKSSIVLFARCRQKDASLQFVFTDQNSLTTVYNAVEPVAINSRWSKVVIDCGRLSGVLNIDKSRIAAIRFISDASLHGDLGIVEIKNIAIRPAVRYNQPKGLKIK